MFVNLLNFHKSNRQTEIEIAQISDQMLDIRNEIEIAVNNFNQADSDALIDIYAYKIKLLNSTYHYLLKQLHEKSCNSSNEGSKVKLTTTLTNLPLTSIGIDQIG